MDQSINIDNFIKKEIKPEENGSDTSFPHFVGDLQNNETDLIKSEIDIVGNLEIDAGVINVYCVTDIEKEIAFCIKSEHDHEDITNIKSTQFIFDGKIYVESSKIEYPQKQKKETKYKNNAGTHDDFPEFQQELDRGPYHTVKHTFCPEGVLPMWVADMDLPVDPNIHAAIQERAKHCTFGYTIQPPEMWDAVSQWLLTQHGWEVERGQFVFCSNLVTATATALQAFTEKGDAVALVRPLYVPLQQLVGSYDKNEDGTEVIAGAGRRLVSFDAGLPSTEQPLTVDLSGLRKLLEVERAKALIWCSPHNPSGRVWTRDELRTVATMCKELRVIIISDEIHADLTLWGLKHTPMALACQDVDYDGVVTMSSPGKTWSLAGLHCGFLVIQNPDNHAKYMKVAEHAYLHFGSAFATVGMMAAYQHGGPWRTRVCRYIESQIEFLEEFISTKIPEIVVVRPQASFLVWLDCSGLRMEAASGSTSELCTFMEKQAKLKLSDGYSFGGEPTCQFQRINNCMLPCRVEGGIGTARECSGTGTETIGAITTRVASRCSREGAT